MKRRKLAIALAAGAAFVLMVVPASAELHRVSVTLVTGETLFMTIDVAPGSSVESTEIPGLPAPVESVTDLGVVATPTPEPAPVPAGTPTPASQAPARPYLRPFPVVRIRGSLTRQGADVSLLRVTAPPDVTVTVRCAGDGCPVRRLKTKPGRLRPFERLLPAGVRITIRVQRRDHIGKYVRIRIRAGSPPARHDACVWSTSSTPFPCPPA